MMESLTKYIAAVLGERCNNPGTKSFDTIKQWVKDPLAVAKLSFFIFSASSRRFSMFLPIGFAPHTLSRK